MKRRASCLRALVARPLAPVMLMLAAAAWFFVPYVQRTFGSVGRSAESNAAAAAKEVSGHWKAFDPARVEGAKMCLDCHRSETAAWFASKHANVVFDELRSNPNSQKYSQALGIKPSDVAKNSVCTTCHATQQRDRAGQLHVQAGVSCESCHNASGGEDGWLNRHAVYGSYGVRRAEEAPEHRERRIADCRTAGQYRSGDIYQLAKACFQCHIAGNERLLNETDHKAGDSAGFEFVAWSLGEVRHNSFLDPRSNAELPTLWADPFWRADKRAATAAERRRLMYVLGTLADLEVSLRNRSGATLDGRFSQAMNSRITAAQELLLGIAEIVPMLELDNLQQALEPAIEKLDEVSADHQPVFAGAADKVAAAALVIAQHQDGTQLGALDDLLPAEFRGDVFQPQ